MASRLTQECWKGAWLVPGHGALRLLQAGALATYMLAGKLCMLAPHACWFVAGGAVGFHVEMEGGASFFSADAKKIGNAGGPVLVPGRGGGAVPAAGWRTGHLHARRQTPHARTPCMLVCGQGVRSDSTWKRRAVLPCIRGVRVLGFSLATQVAWCRFQGEGEALCLLQAGALATYTLAGELQTVPLPPGFAAMWALPQGLLLAVGSPSARVIALLGAGQPPGGRCPPCPNDSVARCWATSWRWVSTLPR